MHRCYGLAVFTCLCISALGMVPPPVNITMDSVNFRNILRWESPPVLSDDAAYIVQYKLDTLRNDNYKEVCHTSDLYCDLSMVTYKFTLRARVEVNDSTSDWVTMQFDPYNHTTISPPEVKVSSRSGNLDVSFFGPYLESGRPLREKYYKLIYSMKYWKALDPAQVMIIKTPQNNEILHQLEAWTIYCLKIQVYIEEYNKSGEFSPVICEMTTDDGKTATWKIALLFLVSMLITFIVTLILTYLIIKTYKMTQYIFYPSYAIPEHLKEYLSKPFYSTPYLPTLPTEEHESCEQLTFISEEMDETKENSA